MNILYIITTFNPRDNNKYYFKYSGYPYNAISSAINTNINSKHKIDVVVADFASGPKTRQYLIDFKDKNPNNLYLLFGPDAAGFVAINKACKVFNKDFIYDYIIFSASDVIIRNTNNFDIMIEDLEKEKCRYCYLNAVPGLELPGEKINPLWFINMSVDDSVHHNAFCVHSSFAKFYDNRIIPDRMDGSFETLIGYYCAAAGVWRKISSHLEMIHLPKTGIKTDRKTAYTNKNLCRGDSWHFPMSAYANHNINMSEFIVSKEAIDAGIYYGKKCPKLIDKNNPLSEKRRHLMEIFIKKHFLLNEQELSYNNIITNIY